MLKPEIFVWLNAEEANKMNTAMVEEQMNSLNAFLYTLTSTMNTVEDKEENIFLQALLFQGDIGFNPARWSKASAPSFTRSSSSVSIVHEDEVLVRRPKSY